MRLSAIEDIIHDCSASLDGALFHYWPTTNESEMSERNLTLHVAGSLGRAGFHCYSECRWAASRRAEGGDGNQRSRLDMLAWQPKRRTLLLVEAKRLHGVGGVRSIVTDVRRILSFRPRARLGAWHQYGVILASTWSPKIASWWTHTHTKEDPWFKGTLAWNQLAPHVRARVEEGRWEAIRLKTEPARPGRVHSLLYGVFQVF